MILSTSSPMRAAHIIGGDVTYELKGYNQDSSLATYEVTFIIYRDTASSAPYFDLLAAFGVYRKPTGATNWQSYDVVDNIPVQDIQYINAFLDPCKDELLSDLSIESGEYNFEVTLETGDYTYMIAYQRCCRNWSINNIERPGETGAVYDIIVTSLALKEKNTSPVFREYPPTFVCLNEDINFDHSAIDAEGDSMIYYFCTPFSSGINEPFPPNVCCNCLIPDPRTCVPEFDRVVYTGIYSESNPLGGDPQITIDRHSGVISGSPDLLGSYVVSVCMEEYRGGEYIGSYRRDFEFNVAMCNPEVVAQIRSDSMIIETEYFDEREAAFFQQCDPEVEIWNESYHIGNIRSYKWHLYDAEDALINVSFDRNVMYALPDYGEYYGYMVINDLEICVDTSFFRIDVLPLVEPQISYAYEVCQEGSLQLENVSNYQSREVAQWTWEVNGISYPYQEQITIADPRSGANVVKLTAIDQFGCQRSAMEVIQYQIAAAATVDQLSSVNICTGDSVLFEGEYVHGPGEFIKTYVSNLTGCDSAYRSIIVTNYPAPLVLETDTFICNGDSLRFFGSTYGQSGTFEYSIKHDGADCDSVRYMINLEVGQFPILVNVDTTICVGDSVRFENRWVKKPDTYISLIKSSRSDCDSLQYVLHLDVYPDEVYQYSDTVICYGDTVTYQSIAYTTSQIIDTDLQNTNGCDSVFSQFEIGVREPLRLISNCTDSIRPYLDTRIEIEVNRDVQAEWSPTIGLSCTDCLDPMVNLEADQEYVLTVTDDLGCTITKTFQFFVDPVIDFYFPNIISKAPINNPINEVAFLQCSHDYEFTYDIYIFDRWGKPVFEAKGLKTNRPEVGWLPEGYLAGVYAYYIDIKEDVTPRDLEGDLTVVR